VTTLPCCSTPVPSGGWEPDPSGHFAPTVRVLDLHYDADFERLAVHTDLAVAVQALAALGSLPEVGGAVS